MFGGGTGLLRHQYYDDAGCWLRWRRVHRTLFKYDRFYSGGTKDINALLFLSLSFNDAFTIETILSRRMCDYRRGLDC
jgi:hypothetical protein